MDIKIIVATHKKYNFPEDPMYLPVHAGSAVHDYVLPYTADNSGDNISGKNASYCELTALYWAWKNLDADYIGLCHYRRYFCGWHGKQILTMQELQTVAERFPIILPKKRNYFIETNYSQYVHAHHAQDLDLTREILGEQCGREYCDAFDRVMRRTDGHRFNMMIMRRDLLDQYCSWLFGVLFELEQRLDTSGYSAYDARVYGFVAERLLDVWLEAKQFHYTELPYVFTEKQNWLKKGSAFLKRKFLPKR